MGLGESERSDVTVTVTRSSGNDRAVVVFIDTNFEPDGSDGGPALRVLINDHDTYLGARLQSRPDGSMLQAQDVTVEVALDDIKYHTDEDGSEVSVS